RRHSALGQQRERYCPCDPREYAGRRLRHRPADHPPPAQHPADAYRAAGLPRPHHRESRPDDAALWRREEPVMTKLRLAAIPDDRPVKITTEIQATVHRDLVMYAEILARANGEAASPD